MIMKKNEKMLRLILLMALVIGMINYTQESIAQEELDSSDNFNPFFQKKVARYLEYDELYPCNIVKENGSFYIDYNPDNLNKTKLLEYADTLEPKDKLKIINKEIPLNKSGELSVYDYSKPFKTEIDYGITKCGLSSTIIEVFDVSAGRFIDSYYNVTGGFVQRNKSFSEGYYLPPINFTFFNGSAVTVNITWNENQTITFTPTNSVNGTVRLNFTMDGDLSVSESTKNISTFEGKKLLFALEFEDSTRTFVRDIVSGIEPKFISTDGNSKVIDGWDDRGFNKNLSLSDTRMIAFPPGTFDNNVKIKHAFLFNDTEKGVDGVGYNNSNGTYAFWLKTGYAGSTAMEIFEFNEGDARMLMRGSDKRLQGELTTNTMNCAFNVQSITPDADTWTHIAWVKDDARLTHYQNGVNVSSIACSGNFKAFRTTSPCNSVADNDCQIIGEFGFNGTFDSFRLYAGALTSTEVLKLVNEKNWTEFSAKQTDTGVSEDLYNYSVGVQDISEIAPPPSVTPPLSGIIKIHETSTLKFYQNNRIFIYGS